MVENIEDLTNQAKETIDKIIYLTIATSNKNFEPWNSPVYSAFDEDYNFYWLSFVDSQHSKNILENENVFIVIYDSTAPEGTGFGVYMKGKASKLEKENREEIHKAVKLLFGRVSGNPGDPKKYVGSFPRRVYKFVPEKVWVNSKGEKNGNFIDIRVDITKEILKSTA